MRTIDKIYINGAFVTPHGTDRFDLISPLDNTITGQVILGDEQDTRLAIAAAKAAFPAFSQSSKAQRIEWLQKLQDAVSAHKQQLITAMVEEYGAPLQFCTMSVENAINGFREAIETLENFEFTKKIGRSQVILEPIGVVGIITPWNASNSFICNKLSTAIAAGCTTVIKPSEMSARQTQTLLEALHEAGLPAGVFNIVNGLGPIIGGELTTNPDIAKISFTGSTIVGKTIARNAVDTMKRVTLELGGKSPNILLDDADLGKAIPMAVAAAFMNNGQACIAGTRLLVPERRLEEIQSLVKTAVEALQTGDPSDTRTAVGPLVSKKQYERVQHYIRLGIEEGAQLLTGGTGHPENLAQSIGFGNNLENGNFVKPTVFTKVTNDMRIAREEIFGPVLSIISYKDEEDAIRIANDTDYGLHAYVSSSNPERAHQVARRITAGRVAVNILTHDPKAPFGGFKQSGIGREYGVYGLEEYVEPKTILG